MLILLPVAQVFQSPALSAVAIAADRAFATVCHQIDSRSFHIMGFRLGVCSRCASIYGGFLVGILFWRIALRRPARNNLILWGIALVPMLADVILDGAEIYSGGSVTRIITGGWFGIFAGVILTPLFIQGWTGLTSAIIHQSKKAYESATE